MRSNFLLSIVAITGLLFATPAFGFQTGESATKKWDRERDMLLVMSEMINRNDLAPELEIVAEQQRELEEIFAAFRKTTRKFSIEQANRRINLIESGVSEEEQKQVMATWKDQDAQELSKLARTTIQRINALLLPHQLKRLKELVLQRQILREVEGDKTKIFVGLLSRINLPRETKRDIEEKSKELRLRYLQRLKKLEQDYHREVLGLFPPENRREMKELVGEIYLDEP